MAFRVLGDNAVRLRRVCGALGYVPGMSATCGAIATESYGWPAAGISPEEAQRRAGRLLEELERQRQEVTRSIMQVYWERGLRPLECMLETMRGEAIQCEF
jgi:hypothetical protein